MSGHVSDVGGSRIVDLGRTDSRVVVTPSGHAVFVRDGALVAQPLRRLARSRPVGRAVPARARTSPVSQPTAGPLRGERSDAIVDLGTSERDRCWRTRLTRRGLRAARRRAAGRATRRTSAARACLPGWQRACWRSARRDPLSGTRDLWMQDLDVDQPPVRLASRSARLTWPRRGLPTVKQRAVHIRSSGERDLYRKDVALGSRPEGAGHSRLGRQQEPQPAWSPQTAGPRSSYDTGARGRDRGSVGRINKDLLVVSLGPGDAMARPLAATRRRRVERGHRAGRQARRLSGDRRDADRCHRRELPRWWRAVPGDHRRWQRTHVERRRRRALFRLAGARAARPRCPRRGWCAAVRAAASAVPAASNARREPSYAPLPGGRGFVVLADEPPAPQRLRALLNWRSAAPR